MARINNTGTIKRILDDAKIQTSVDNVPQELGKTVVPVLISNPKRICNVVANAAAAGMIYTTPTNKDFYLTGIAHTASSTAAGGNKSRLKITLPGQAQVVLNEIQLHNTAAIDAASETVIQDFVHPILLERGSTLSTVAAGTLEGTSATIVGYTVED